MACQVGATNTKHYNSKWSEISKLTFSYRVKEYWHNKRTLKNGGWGGLSRRGRGGEVEEEEEEGGGGGGG